MAMKSALCKLLSVLLPVVAAFTLAWPVQALEVPPYEGQVNDRAGFLAEADRARLNAEMQALQQRTGVRVTLLTIPTLAGEELNAFFLKTAQTWGEAVAGGDKDILLLVSAKEGAVRMAVGEGLDKGLYNRILTDEIFPYFKANRPGEGLASGLTAMARAAETGAFTPGATARELAAAAKPSAAKPSAAKPSAAKPASAQAGAGQAEDDPWQGLKWRAFVACLIGLIAGFFLGIVSLVWWWVPGVAGALAGGGMAAVKGGALDVVVCAVVGMLTATLFAKLFVLLKIFPSFDRTSDED